ncbi:MAG: hypothetical protein UHO61_03945 [Acutalibacteraceae bacterium]|nr:hypothetical protein [Acutalibacteraceae bacterium]
MKDVFKDSGKLFLKIVAVNFICFFIAFSLSVLTTAAFSKNIGYKAYGTTSDSSDSQELYTYYYEDGDDTQRSSYEEDGYTVSTVTIRSEISKSGKVVFLILTQVLCLLILMGFIYSDLWKNGTGDSNLVKFEHKKEDKLKGVKIGALATIPNYLFLIYLVIAKLGLSPDFSLVLYKFLNSSVYSFVELIFGKAITVSQLAVWQFVLLFLLPLLIPAIAGVSYILGYKNISISEKLVYKNKGV